MAEIAKLGNGQHVRSLARDGRFMAALLGVRAGAECAEGDGTSVGRASALPPTTPLPSPLVLGSSFLSTQEIIKELEAELEAIDLESARAVRATAAFADAAHQLWQHHHWPAEALAVLPRQYRQPAPWRDTTDVLRLTYIHRALLDAGPVHSFSLNLDPAVESLAKSQRDTARWLNKRLARWLDKFLGRRVDLWFVLEDLAELGPRHRRLHLHGALGINADEAKKARAALRKAGGEWEDVRQHQSHTKANPDYGWVGYAAKGLVWHSPHVEKLLDLADDRHRRKIFTGSSWAASASIRKRAELLYTRDRAGRSMRSLECDLA